MEFVNNTNGQISLDAGRSKRLFTEWVQILPGETIDTGELRARLSENGIAVHADIDERAADAGLTETGGEQDMDEAEPTDNLTKYTIQELLDIAKEDGIEIAARKKGDIIDEIIGARGESE